MARSKNIFKSLFFVLLILLSALALFSCIEDYSDVTIINNTVKHFGKDIDVKIPPIKDGVRVTKIDVVTGLQNYYPAKTLTIPSTIASITQSSLRYLSNLEAFYVDPDNQFFQSIDGVLYDKSGTVLLCYPDKKKDETFVIPESVGIIAERAFSGNSYLKEITISNSVAEIGSYAFAGLTSLVEITLPDSVITIKDNAFYNCYLLNSVNIGSNVKTIGDNAFFRCTSLRSIVLPDSVKKLGDNIFQNCTSLKEIVMPKGITYIPSGMFSGCSSLTSFVVPDKVKYIYDSAFSGSGIKDITLPEGLLNIGSSFQHCTSLTSITIPASVTTMRSAFEDCKNLKTVTFLGGGINFSGNCFSNCDKLTEIYVQNNVDWATMSFINAGANPLNSGAKLYIAGNFVTSFEFPEGTTSINAYLFAEYDYLESVTIPEGVTDIERGAFLGCNKITEIILPLTVNYIDHGAFGRCTSLKTVYLPSLEWWLNARMTAPGLFTNAETVYVDGQITTSIVVPEGTERIESYTFYECKFLTDIFIPVSVRYLSSNSIALCGELNIHYGASTKEFQYLENNSHYWYGNGDNYTVYCSDGIITY